MTENPYAAPELASQGPQLSPAVRGIRAVSKGLRILGWICFFLYLPGALGAIFFLIYKLIHWESHTNEAILPAVGSTFLQLGIVIFGWISIRVGRKLPTGNRTAYRAAMILSCLMLIVFPLAPMGIYCLLKLRKHWRPYCEEIADTSSANG